ncbi:MAG: inositol monophosphatase family protein [Gaiellaceae bacterium]
MLTDRELDECAEVVDLLARYAIERIVADRPRADQIGTKTNDADWVTETDVAVERHVRDELRARFPRDTIVGEELGSSEVAESRASWYVDPVDGTTNFVHGLPWSSFSIAVCDESGPAVGAVADPYRREILSAIRGRGARRNSEPTRCSDTRTLVGGIFLTELSMQSLWRGQATLMESLAGAGCVTRIMGSNALSLASVGAGRALATIVDFNLVDGQAGTLVARESGADVRFEGKGVLAAAPGVADELAHLWHEARNGH